MGGLTLDMSMAEYRREANFQNLVLPQIESKAALDHLDAIVRVPGIDGVFVGPVDLAISLGVEPDLDNPHSLVREALDDIVRAAGAQGLRAGIYCSSASAAAERIRQGFLLVNVVSDVGALLQGVRSQLEWTPETTDRIRRSSVWYCCRLRKVGRSEGAGAGIRCAATSRSR